jgi:hypothetical protein
MLRATSRIIIGLHDGLELLDYMMSLLSHSQSDYEKYLCLQSLVVTFEDPEILRLYNERHISTISVILSYNVLLVVLDRNAEPVFENCNWNL